MAALWLRLDAPWWAAISAFVCTQASRPASVIRAAERILGTILGALAAFLLAPWLSEHNVLVPPALLCFTTVGIVGASLGRHGYSWLLGGITADLVVLAMLGRPTAGQSIALSRSAEIGLGSAAALCVALLVGAPETSAAQPMPPGWSTLFGRNLHVLNHAVRTGLAVMLVPLVWSWFGLPGIDQMAISVAAVMAVPGLLGNPEQAELLMHQRSLHRVAGCALGGFAGLAVLGVGVALFAAWLAVLLAGVWVGSWLQTTPRETGYVGQQATVAFILTLVQGWGPPLTLTPGVERLVGILLGVLILLAVSAAWPTPRSVLSQ